MRIALYVYNCGQTSQKMRFQGKENPFVIGLTGSASMSFGWMAVTAPGISQSVMTGERFAVLAYYLQLVGLLLIAKA